MCSFLYMTNFSLFILVFIKGILIGSVCGPQSAIELLGQLHIPEGKPFFQRASYTLFNLANPAERLFELADSSRLLAFFRIPTFSSDLT